MLIIFDLDGPFLKASWRALYEGYKAMITSMGKDYRKYFSNFREFKEWWTPDWRVNDAKLGFSGNKLNPHQQEFYRIHNSYVYLFAWANKVVCDLIRKNHQLAIFTNRHCENAKSLIKPIMRYFSCIIGGDNVAKLKPNPEGIYLIINNLRWTDKNDVIMIGDMPEDLMAGKAAGVKTGAVRWGLGKWERLLAQNPDYKFETYKDLLKI